MKQMAAEPVSDEELNTSAKRAFIERFPRTFATKAQVANTFAQDEFTGRYAKEPEFWKKYRSRIEAVAQGGCSARRQEIFVAGETRRFLIVGQKEEILKGHPNHPVSLARLANDRIVELPLRDPLTMKPMTITKQ